MTARVDFVTNYFNHSINLLFQADCHQMQCKDIQNGWSAAVWHHQKCPWPHLWRVFTMVYWWIILPASRGGACEFIQFCFYLLKAWYLLLPYDTHHHSFEEFLSLLHQAGKTSILQPWSKLHWIREHLPQHHIGFMHLFICIQPWYLSSIHVISIFAPYWRICIPMHAPWLHVIALLLPDSSMIPKFCILFFLAYACQNPANVKHHFVLRLPCFICSHCFVCFPCCG